jgi:predicted DNA-binding protein (MmcQ/YjbR family)
MKLDINKIWGINGFEGIIVNPPFEDKENKNKTQHKLWIDFTKKTFKSWLLKGGLLFQISPSSFSTPSSKILNIFKEKHVRYLFLNQEVYFPKVNTTISWYIVDNTDKNELTSDEDNFNETNNKLTTIINDKYKIIIDEKLLYLPNDFCNESISIHNKVMFITENKFDVLKDYVTAHNVLLKKENSTISKTKTEKHIYPVFHTNKQIWYSSIKQSFSDMKKVMWTRSGYTKPFYDDSNYGVTDLAYYILVEDDDEGNNLAHNLNSKLFKYILKTAKWSGFGNDKVFYALPKLPNKKMNDADIFKLFNLSNEEIDYIN